MPIAFDSITAFVSSAGALGAAAFGLVEAAKKVTPLGTAGLGRLRKALGVEVEGALTQAYGPGAWDLVLKGAYLESTEAVAALLRTGLRVALDGDDRGKVAASLGLPEATVSQIQKAYRAAREGSNEGEKAPEALKQLGRIELALEARIRGAVALAEETRVGTLQATAGVLAVAGALLAAALLPSEAHGPLGARLSYALLLGLCAVPLAPISKDLVSLLRSAKAAVARRGA